MDFMMGLCTVNMLKNGGSFTMQNGVLTTKNHRFNSDMFRVQWDIYNQQIVFGLFEHLKTGCISKTVNLMKHGDTSSDTPY